MQCSQSKVDKMLARVLLLAALTGGLFWPPSVLSDSLREWHFDDVPADQVPPNFLTGTFFDGRPAGEWKVIKVPEAISPPPVLAQLRNKGAEGRQVDIGS
jgi:hypothetical protein